MAEQSINNTFREQRLTVPASSVIEVNFQDTRPNHVYFANNSAYNLYVSISSLVSDSLFDMIVPPYALKMFLRPELLHQIYVANVSTLGSADFVCQSFLAPFDPKNLIQTQEIVGASASGLLGIIQVSSINGALPAGTNQIGFVKLGAEIPAGTKMIGYVGQALDASANGGTIHHKKAAASTNATSIKSSAGRVHSFTVHNSAAAAKFLKFYNKASAPTVGTDTPVLVYPVAAGQSLNVAPPGGISFNTGIAYAMTGAVADSDTTALTANDLILNLVYA